MSLEPFDAIVLAGGQSRRLGRPKQDVVLGGATLLQRTLAAVEHAGTVVVVGPPRDDLPPGVLQTRESPAGGGPVAGVVAGLSALNGQGGARDVLVLACDMPLVDRVVAELETCGGADAVLLRDRDRLQPLAARFRVDALRAAAAGVDADGASMRALLSRLVVTPHDVAPGTTDDVDRPDDLAVCGTVADHLVSKPYLLPPDADVAAARALFVDDHVHADLIVDTGVLTAVVLRSDLGSADDRARAADLGRLAGRTVEPSDDAELVRRRMVADGVRRLAVVGEDGRLLGLLCLKRTGLGFCSDAGVEARRRVDAAPS
ncbi:NTP transferase domain-containing protein [Aeromicrobium sp. Leaf350]|uniref:NTP transferase domain-containing protein n=1 Tax=Aeromicrobium sp. Leaf350 TaxID=2876565 RepID=UPI001E41136A|nr:NTP transferase domain-containing protein [Aeromicrobium sp. Leaf350]